MRNRKEKTKKNGSYNNEVCHFTLYKTNQRFTFSLANYK